MSERPAKFAAKAKPPRFKGDIKCIDLKNVKGIKGRTDQGSFRGNEWPEGMFC
jgi:hypothetical protein